LRKGRVDTNQYEVGQPLRNLASEKRRGGAEKTTKGVPQRSGG